VKIEGTIGIGDRHLSADLRLYIHFAVFVYIYCNRMWMLYCAVLLLIAAEYRRWACGVSIRTTYYLPICKIIQVCCVISYFRIVICSGYIIYSEQKA